MGSWDVGSFDSDEALDWLAETEDAAGVEQALQDVRFDSARRCVEAIAACEIVAATLGQSDSQHALEWLAERPGTTFEPAMIEAARGLVEGIENSSELQALWDEGSVNDAWHLAVRDLVQRLERRSG